MKKRLAKKMITAALILGAAVCMGACGKKGDTTDTAGTAKETQNLPDFKTFADVFAVGDDQAFYSSSNEKIVYVVHYDDRAYKVIGKTGDEVYSKIDAVYREAVNDPNRDDSETDKEIQDILKDVAVDEIIDLTAGIPDQAELDTYKGKTGQQMSDDGFEISGCSSGEDGTATIYFTKGAYEFEATMKEKAKDPDNFDGYTEGLTMTVDEFKYSGISYNATGTDD